MPLHVLSLKEVKALFVKTLRAKCSARFATDLPEYDRHYRALASAAWTRHGNGVETIQIDANNTLCRVSLTVTIDNTLDGQHSRLSADMNQIAHTLRASIPQQSALTLLVEFIGSKEVPGGHELTCMAKGIGTRDN